jgi:hypothetical protein
MSYFDAKLEEEQSKCLVKEKSVIARNLILQLSRAAA